MLKPWFHHGPKRAMGAGIRSSRTSPAPGGWCGKTHYARAVSRGFTLLEMMAVVVIMMVLLGTAALTFANARPAVKVKKDASQMVAFLRNMWDRTKTTGAPLILRPDYEKGALSYTDPRSGKTFKATFSAKVRVIGIQLNDRFYSTASYGELEDTASDAVSDPNALYVSEGRGLTRVGVLFGIPKGESYQYPTLSVLNLITGKGAIYSLSPEELEDFQARAEETEYETQP